MSPKLQVADPVTANAVLAVSKASHFLLGRQHAAGFWWEDLTADTTLESDYILFQLWLYRAENGV